MCSNPECLADREVSINKSIALEVVVVIAEGIEHGFGHLHPTHVEDKLEELVSSTNVVRLPAEHS